MAEASSSHLGPRGDLEDRSHMPEEGSRARSSLGSATLMTASCQSAGPPLFRDHFKPREGGKMPLCSNHGLFGFSVTGRHRES